MARCYRLSLGGEGVKTGQQPEKRRKTRKIFQRESHKKDVVVKSGIVFNAAGKPNLNNLHLI